jgi:hypothetical protein
MKTIIMPVGHERTKIIARLGRDHYTYAGSPQRGQVRHETLGTLDVWFFDYAKFEPDVQVLIAQRYIVSHPCSFSEAVHYCKTHQHAIPCDQIDLEGDNDDTSA